MYRADPGAKLDSVGGEEAALEVGIVGDVEVRALEALDRAPPFRGGRACAEIDGVGLFAATIHAQNINASSVTTNRLCVGSICVTPAQFEAVFSSQTAAAGAAAAGSQGATGGPSAPTDTEPPMLPDQDDAGTTTASSTPAAVNDNNPPLTEGPVNDNELPDLQAANDNEQIADELPATGTE